MFPDIGVGGGHGLAGLKYGLASVGVGLDEEALVGMQVPWRVNGVVGGFGAIA